MKRITEGIRRAALYARVSTEEQAMHGVSLEAQVERLRSYAQENNLVIVDTYVDEGVSARKRYTVRAEVMRMLKDIEAKKIDVILFIKLDRWFRNIADYYEVQSILDKHGVQWIATEEDYDTTTANGRLSLNIKLAIAQDEADRTSERIKFAFKRMVEDGRVISGVTPRGYKIENKRPVVDDEAAEVVKVAFEKMVDFRSMKRVQIYLIENYNVNIDLKSLKHLLTNPWYIGNAHGIEGSCPTIINKPLFDLVGNIVATRAARFDRTRSDRVYLFTGLLICGCCGRRMSTYSHVKNRKNGTQGSRYIYYRCQGHFNRKCEMTKQINQDTLEKWLLENIAVKAQEYNLSLSQSKKDRPRKIHNAEKIRQKLDKLKDLYLNDLILKDAYAKEFAALTASLNDAEEQLKEETKPLDLSTFKNFTSIYKTLTQEQKKALWSRIVEKIVVTPEGDYLITFCQL